MEDARKLADKVDAMYRVFAKPAADRGTAPSTEWQFPDLKEANLYGS